MKIVILIHFSNYVLCSESMGILRNLYTDILNMLNLLALTLRRQANNVTGISTDVNVKFEEGGERFLI